MRLLNITNFLFMTFACLLLMKQVFAKSDPETKNLACLWTSYKGQNQNNDGAQFQSESPSSIESKSLETNSLQAQNQQKLEAQKLMSKLSMKVKSNKALSRLLKYNYINSTLNKSMNKQHHIRKDQNEYGRVSTEETDNKPVELVTKPRKGSSGPPSQYTYMKDKPEYRKKNVTYKFKSLTTQLSPCKTRNIIRRAFRLWEEKVELNFIEKDGDEPVDTAIKFTFYGNYFLGKHNVLAEAWLHGDIHFDENELWTLGKGKIYETFLGNSNGSECVFPFFFEGRRYSSCTTDGVSNGLEWCATTDNFDKDKKFGFCPSELLFTIGGNGNGKPCKFPFTYKGVEFNRCTTYSHSDNYKWCATTSSYDKDQRWGRCPDRHPKRVPTDNGNSQNAPCHFPFVYRGVTYYKCTSVDREDGLLWCSTTANYDGYVSLCDPGRNLLKAAAHEIGHTIGLNHSERKSAWMYGNYDSITNSDDKKLSRDDILGAISLYSHRRSPLLPLKQEVCDGSLDSFKNSKLPEGPKTSLTKLPTTNKKRKSNSNFKQLLCNSTTVDAITNDGSSLLVFKGTQFWRIGGQSKKKSTKPVKISTRWPGGPQEIDAICKIKKSFMLFKGNQYWIYQNRKMEDGYPKSLTNLGFPDDIQKIDAAFKWNRTSVKLFVEYRTYIYDTKKAELEKSSYIYEADAAFEDSNNKDNFKLLMGNRVLTYSKIEVDYLGQEKLGDVLKCL